MRITRKSSNIKMSCCTLYHWSFYNIWFKDDNYITVYYVPRICWWTSELICPSEWVCSAHKLKWPSALWGNDMFVMLSADWPSLSPFRGAQKETQIARRQSVSSEQPAQRKDRDTKDRGRTEGYEHDPSHRNRDVCQCWLTQDCAICDQDNNSLFSLLLNDL